VTVRSRAQVATCLLAGAVLAAGLTSVGPLSAATATQLPAEKVTTHQAPRTTAAETAGKKAGRKAGAAAGAKAGRKAGARSGASAAAAGEKAGRAAGATAGAKAGKKAGAKGGAKAGAKAGAVAGAKAGKRAGARIAADMKPKCGVITYRKPDGTPWACTFGDDFTGTTLDPNKWRVMTTAEFSYGDRPDCFVNSPNNVKVGGGVLTLTSRKEKAMFNCPRKGQNDRLQYTAGMVSTYQKFNQAYGRWEFRAKFPNTEENGVQTSMWLWPAGASGASWPISGEIDVAEWYSHFNDRVIPFLHTSGSLLGGTKSTTNNFCMVDRVQDWHTYVLEWVPGSLRILYDGKLCLENNTKGAPFDKSYFMSLFQGYGLDRNKMTASTPASSSAQFAWVRVWS
jgi:beta-glucanase (GH16 family)